MFWFAVMVCRLKGVLGLDILARKRVVIGCMGVMGEGWVVVFSFDESK